VNSWIAQLTAAFPATILEPILMNGLKSWCWARCRSSADGAVNLMD